MIKERTTWKVIKEGGGGGGGVAGGGGKKQNKTAREMSPQKIHAK